jgi:predicted enzyme related to lactoylglutathione lyase
MTATPKATGLFEAHLTVSDLDRSVEFYRDVVGLPLALVLEEREAAFFWIGGTGEAMLGLWSLGSAPMGLSLHIALSCSTTTTRARSRTWLLRRHTAAAVSVAGCSAPRLT